MKWYWWVFIAFMVSVLILSLLLKRKIQQRQTDFVEKVIEMQKTGKTFTAQDAQDALVKVAAVHGKAAAAEIERVARLETAHFTSKQYQLTGTGGMEAHGIAPYYGWWAPFFIAHPEYTPVGTTEMLEGQGLAKNGGLDKTFVIMPSTEAWMMFLADYAKRYASEGGIARWYSTNATSQQNYRNTLAGIVPRFTNAIA